MKKTLLGLCFLLIGTFAHAQTQGLENIIVEKYYVSNAADSVGAIGNGDTLPVGSVTYRVYADMLPGYKFQAAYGVPAHSLIVSTTTSFYNNTDRGHEIPSYSKSNAAQNSTMLDSWFSAGAACLVNHGVLKSEDDIAGGANVINANGILQNNDISAGIPLTTADGIYSAVPNPSAVTFVNMAQEQSDFDGGPSSNGINVNNSSWASLVGATGPTSSNRVLIGQFTTNGCFSFQLNIQIGTPTGGIQNFVANNPTGNEIYFPACTFPLVSGITSSTGSTVLPCSTSSISLVATGGGTYLWDNGSTNALRTVTTAGNYTVIINGGNGCTFSSSILVTSNSDVANPSIYLQSGATLAGITGPSTSQSPYVQPAKPGVQVTSILTANESVGGYKMSGIPDGTGAFDNGNGTFTLLVNHEIPSGSGVVRAHGSLGAYVSKWIINKNNLSVVSGSDLMQQAYLWNGTSHVLATPGTAAFNRFCSADLPPVSAFYNINTGKGTTERIFMNGEEGGVDGRAVGHIVTGLNAGKSYQLPWLGKFAWENAVASPSTGDTTLVCGLDDGTGGQVYFYIGTKTTLGNEIDKAGLNNGKLYGVVVNGFPIERVNSTTINPAPAPNTAFSLVDLGVVTNLTGTQLNTNSVTAGVTSFSRPEDGAWDPSNPNDFYFATTDQYDQVKDGIGSQVGRTRVWKLSFTNIASPSLGGTITAVLDGTEDIQMIDNMCVDNFGHLILQEDVGNQQHNGKIWQYTIATDQLTLIAKHDQARFGNLGVPATAPFNQDEEASGVIDASSILGPGMFLAVDQAHSNTGMPADVYENGQIFAFFNPESYGAGTAKDTVFAYANTGCSATGVNLGVPATADNCNIASVTSNAPGSFPIGNTNVIWTVVDGSGNSALATQVVVVLDTIPAPVITGNLIFCSGGSTTLSVGSFAAYSWSTGATTQTLSVSTAGIYTVTVTKSNGCTASASATVSSTEILLNGVLTNIQCNGETDGEVDITVSGGVAPFSYSWSNGSTTEDLTGVAAGTYTVIITDSIGCSASAAYSVLQPSVIVASLTQVNVSCNGGSNGSIDLSVSGGSGSYTFLWEDFSTNEDRSGLVAGTYTVVVYDLNSCSATVSATITQAAALSISCGGTNVTCNNGNNGTASVVVSNGSTPYSYSWSNGNSNSTINNLSSGTYTVIVSDACGTTLSCEYTVTQPVAISISGIVTPGCKNTANGLINITVSGGLSPFTYLWSNGNTNEDITALNGGVFTVTVTDANNCSNMASFTIVKPAALLINISKTNVRCGGKLTGVATVNPVGGQAPYTYLWNNGSTSATISNLTAGVYSVLVSDAAGCTKSATATITQNAPVIVTVIPSGNSATAFATGGVAPYTYLWKTVPNQYTQTATGLISGATYKVNVTDSKGCTVLGIITMPLIRSAALTPESSLKVYPNPTTDAVTIALTSTSEQIYSLNIIDIIGNVVFNKSGITSVGENLINYNFENLAKGIYAVNIKTSDLLLTTKVIVK